jgi:hypothetical protein
MSQSESKLSRRTLFAGAGTASAVAVVASAIPSMSQTTGPVAPQAKVAPLKGGGYALTEHVKRYYKTTLV